MIIQGTTQEKIIDFVLEALPSGFTLRRKEKVEQILLWKQYRRDVLKMYAIPFKKYCERVRYYRKAFGE